MFTRWKPSKKKILSPLTLDDAAGDAWRLPGGTGPSTTEPAPPASPSRAAEEAPAEPRLPHPDQAPDSQGAAATPPPPEHAGDEAALSDIEDDEIEIYLADKDEVAYKEEIWNMMNRDWLERQAAKAAVAAAAEKAAAEQRAAQEAAEAAGVAFKRSRGRPLGSKSKPRPDSGLPPPDTPQEVLGCVCVCWGWLNGLCEHMMKRLYASTCLIE